MKYRKTRYVILIILPLLFAGCRLGYVLQAANGEIKKLLAAASEPEPETAEAK